jgi:hypothetical protein
MRDDRILEHIKHELGIIFLRSSIFHSPIMFGQATFKNFYAILCLAFLVLSSLPHSAFIGLSWDKIRDQT